MNLPGLAHSRPAENRAHPGLARVPILTGLSFSTKLILLVVVPLVLTLVVTLPLTVTDLNRLASEISAERLDGAVRIIDQQFEDLEESLNNMADEIARNPRLLAAVRETDVPVIVSNLLSTRIRLGIQHLEVVDLNGVRLGHDHQPGTNYDWEAINLLNTQGLSEIATITMVPSSQGWWLTAVRPLKDSEGLIGAVTVGKEIDAGALAEVIFGESAPLIRVLNEDGEVVSASYSNIDQSRSIPITLDPALVEVALSGRKVVGSATIDGTEKRTAYSPFVLGSGYRGVFAVALTTSPVVGLRDQIIAKHVLVTAALALVVLGVGYMVIRTITRRILLLRDGAVEIANGNLSVRIEETVNDEMGALAHEFNRMADSLNEKNTQLEQANRNLEMRVFERTEALEQTNAQLLEAQSQLVRTEKLAAIGAMSAGVAHDLRNPLGAIWNGIYS